MDTQTIITNIVKNAEEQARELSLTPAGISELCLIITDINKKRNEDIL